MNEMANVASVNVEFTNTNTTHDVSYENEIESKNTDFNVEQNDSRVTDPDGAQSPASSSYADCEDQNDNSNSENLSESDKKDITEADDIQRKDIVTEEIRQEIDSSETYVESVPEPNEKHESDEKDSTAENKNVENAPQNDDSEMKDNSSDVEIVDSNAKYEDTSENEEELYPDEEDLEGENYDNKEYKSEHGDEDSDAGSIQENDRENGDGEEVQEDDPANAQKKLDDDEDRRNPQYIPKKGFFYEHDDRTVTDEETSDTAKKEAEEKESENVKAKSKRSIPDGRWEHDMYRDDEQKPKSSQELIDSYGYDIRNEESAPKARRRRRYGRGPNKYTRKWDDEEAYEKQIASKRFQPRNKPSFKHEEYDQNFPVLEENRKPRRSYRSKEISSSSKRHVAPEPTRSYDTKPKEEFKSTAAPQKATSSYLEKSRSFVKKLPGAKEQRPSSNTDNYDHTELRSIQKTIRNPNYVANNEPVPRGSGRGIGHGKSNRYPPDTFGQSPRLTFTPGNRGRAKRLVKSTQYYYSGKPGPDGEVQELAEQVSAVDLNADKRGSADKNQSSGDIEKFKANEQFETLHSAANAAANVRSKRYSHQRQRLLPEASKSTPTNVNLHQNVQPQSIQPPITHTVQNVQTVSSGMCQPITNAHPAHQAIPLMTQNQCTPPPPQSVAAPLSVTPASIPSSSMAVSASLIPLSAPPLTASGPGLSGTAPPLPIMGFFQHPQGFTNQGTAAQIYTREQSVMGGPSNQPVQLVAFLPASPMLSNTNHSQSAPPPPPPPPPSGFPTTVMSYQQTAQTPQNPPTFNSESYSIPPVTLAPMPQPPEVYQSRGGVTYYNTRSQVKPRSPPPPRVKAAIPIVPPPANESVQ